MRIAMVGAGYVGLVSGACFSEFGVEVSCVDTDAAKIARLERGEMPIYEPGLEGLVAAYRAAGRLSFTTELGPAVAAADAVFIAVARPIAAWIARHLEFKRLRAWIRSLPPYPSLALFSGWLQGQWNLAPPEIPIEPPVEHGHGHHHGHGHR